MNQLPAPIPPQDYQFLPQMEGEESAPTSPFPIHRILAALRRLWWLPVFTCVLALGAAGALVYRLPPTYVSRGSMWETVKLRLPEGVLFSEDVQTFLGTQAELLQSATLRGQAMARLRSVYTNIHVPLDKEGLPIPVKIRITQVPKSCILVLSASNREADYAQEYLNVLMGIYVDYNKNVRKLVSGDTLASISEGLQKAERDRDESLKELTTFQTNHNLAILEEAGKIAGGHLATLQTQISDLEMENRLLQAPASGPSVDDSGKTNSSLDLLEAATLSSLGNNHGAPSERQTAFKEIELFKLQRERLSRNLRPKHPKIVKLDTEIERGEKILEIFRRQSREQLATLRESNLLRMSNIKTAIKEWETKVTEANMRIGEAQRLRMNLQRCQGIVDHLGALQQNVGISRNIDQETLSVLEPATSPERSHTKEIGILAGGGTGGLVLGLGLILLVAIRDDRLTNIIEVNQKLNHVIVGQIPDMGAPKLGAEPALLQLDDPRHGFAESFRSLRSALLYMAPQAARPRVVLITSALPGEGKSTVAGNFARTLALGGSRVVLLDCDLRRGRLHETLGFQREPGLADALREPAALDRVLQQNCISNLSFIAAGRHSGNAGDLFLDPEFDRLLARLRERFDYVLLDSCPVFAADDATTLAPRVDGTLFVVRSRFSRAAPVREALELLYQRNAKVLGVIFNQADVSARSYYYYKYAEYYASNAKPG